MEVINILRWDIDKKTLIQKLQLDQTNITNSNYPNPSNNDIQSSFLEGSLSPSLIPTNIPSAPIDSPMSPSLVPSNTPPQTNQLRTSTNNISNSSDQISSS